MSHSRWGQTLIRSRVFKIETRAVGRIVAGYSAQRAIELGRARPITRDLTAGQVAIDLAGEVGLQDAEWPRVWYGLTSSVARRRPWFRGHGRCGPWRCATGRCWTGGPHPRGPGPPALLGWSGQDGRHAAEVGPGGLWMECSGLSPAATTSAAVASGPTPKRPRSSGTTGLLRAPQHSERDGERAPGGRMGPAFFRAPDVIRNHRPATHSKPHCLGQART